MNCEPCICILPSRDRNINKQTLENLFIKSCLYFEAEPEIIKSNTRIREFVEVRQMIMCFLRKFGFKLVSIGRFFNKDHTTVIHSQQTIGNLCQTDEDFKYRFNSYKNFMEHK